MAEFKLDVAEVLRQLDNKNIGYYSELTDEQKKSLAPVVLMRWMSAVGEEQVNFTLAKRQGRKKGDGKGKWPSYVVDTHLTQYYLDLTNQVVNVGLHELYKHPELQWMLLTIVGFGEPQQHIWTRSSGKSKAFNNITSLLKKKYPLASYKELDLVKYVMSQQDFKDMLLDMGMDDKEIKDLMTDFKKMKKEQDAKEENSAGTSDYD
jgi:hypothetical protein